MRGLVPGIGWTCEAFDGKTIPTAILASSVDHRTPIAGDNGIVFEPLEAEDVEFKESDHPRGEGGKFASSPGGSTQYHHASANPEDKGFVENKRKAHEHAEYLRGLGHEGVKVSRKEGFGALGAGRMQNYVIRTVHHGQPKKAEDLAIATDPPVSEAQRRMRFAVASGHLVGDVSLALDLSAIT